MPDGGDTISIVFRGVRGSHPMPGPTTLRYGGNTSCQEIRAGGRLIVFDAGTGIISLGNDLAKTPGPKNIAVFFSHNHHDHINGLLYFKPVYMPDTTMHIFGPSDEPGDIMDALETLSSPAAHPVQFSRMGMKTTSAVIGAGDTVIWKHGRKTPHLLKPEDKIGPDDVVVKVLKNGLHPVEGVLNFRLEYRGKSYVYASDVEGDEKHGDKELAEFAKNADLFAHDGQYTSKEYSSGHKGWGHSTIPMAILTAKMAQVKRLAIIHHDPSHDDDQLDEMESKAKKLFPEAFLAKEGQKIIL